ncbi:MAG: ferritin [Peptostreptococcus sp.]|uniref:ferritin n=1 Tax=Peptostreptococcus sp. TaxID=1262 RepID=UPI002FC6BEEC
MEKEVLKAMNEHINLEIYSGYLYLTMSIQMEKYNYKGFSKWLLDHSKEELSHAEDFISYLQKRNVSATLYDIKADSIDKKEPLDIAKLVLKHEAKVTSQIYELHDIAKKNNDYATEVFMHKYINEQIEEEDLAQTIIDKFTFAGDSTAAKYSVDKELFNL